ncbi:MAG TPA: MFS transporter [Hyphomonadaceae bacterium]|nr:MFS transporter [Hyphomonadaceae bacterium]HPN05606.1 MFS transporter [Hyphomonadaceae bacterium]
MIDTTAAPPGAQRTKPYAWVVLAMLAMIYIFNFLDRQLMSVLIESIKHDPAFPEPLTDEQMGWMTGFWFALVYTVLGVIVGFLADRTSRRNILFVGATLWSGFTALCGMATSYPMMLVARVGVGVGEAAGAPPSYSIISDYFPAEKRGLALALFSMGVPLGQAAAIAFGAQIDKMFGWRVAFIGIGVAGVIAAILMLLVVREPKRGAMDPSKLAATANEKSSFGATFWQFISRPALLWTAMGCGLSAFVGYAALGWNASFLLRTLHMTRDELSLWYAIVIGVGIGIGTIASGAIVDIMSKRSRVWYALTPLIAMAAAMPFWYLFTQATDWPMGLALLFLPLLLNIFYLAPALALVSNSVKPSQRTMSSAILLMVLNFVGLGGGPTLVGILSTTFAKQKVAAGMEAAVAGAEGLREAMFWMTPFFFVACAFLALQAMAIHREVKEGRSISDGGLRVGIVLLFVGVAGLAARYILTGPEGMVSGEFMGLLQLVMLLVSTALGGWLIVGAGKRKPAAA